MKRPDESEPRSAPGGRRPPEYVVVVAASDLLKERSQAARANLWDALQTSRDSHHDPELDLEAEP